MTSFQLTWLAQFVTESTAPESQSHGFDQFPFDSSPMFYFRTKAVNINAKYFEFF